MQRGSSGSHRAVGLVCGLRVRAGAADLTPGPVARGPAGVLGSLAERVEAEGLDALFLTGSRAAPRPGVDLDPFVALGALASLTGDLVLGCVSTPVDERPPSILAKVVSGLDVLAGGRVLCCLGTARVPGQDDLECRGEALEICRALFGVPAPSVVGRHFALRRAANEPRPVLHTPLAIELGAAGEGSAARRGAKDELSAALATRFAELVFVDVGAAYGRAEDPVVTATRGLARSAGRPLGSLRLVAILSVGEGERDDLAGRAKSWREAGFDAIVADLPGPLPDAELIGALAGALRPA